MVQGRKREHLSSVMIDALTETRTVQEAADLIQCTPPSIHGRANEEVDVRQAINDQLDRMETGLGEAIVESRGIVSKIARALDMSVGSIYYQIRQRPTMQALMRECREKIIDTAEDNIFHKVETGDYHASVFIVKTLGKDRGYAERRELDVVRSDSADHAPTDNLVHMLNNIAAQQPELVEAEFEVLGEEDREILSKALAKYSPVEEEIA
jgi:hypothetical protein